MNFGFKKCNTNLDAGAQLQINVENMTVLFLMAYTNGKNLQP